jgi:hypothetical protein
MPKAKRNTKKIQYTTGKPSRSNRGTLSFANNIGDEMQIRSLSNPFSPLARGSKIPDSDSTRSVAISLVNRYTRSSDANGNLAVKFAPNLAAHTATATTITGNVVTTFGAATATVDNTAVAAQFKDYRIVSWGVKIYSTLAPTSQSGFFTVITNPTLDDGMDASSSFFEETKTYPVTETSTQWISKPIGNSYRDYVAIASGQSWDEVVIYASGLPVSTAGCLQFEVYLNLECQVQLGAITSAIATDAADHRPHILTAVGHVAKSLAGSKTAQDAKAGISSWIKRGLAAAAKTGLSLLGQRFGVPASASYALLKDL